MEQIVKIFVHQSYFLDNDLVVDYNIEPEAHVNISQKDWIALIPKGWSGVDEQIAFKTVDTDCDIVNEAIKSIVMEKKCFQNIVKCEKQYQLMYISQYLEILGRSEYFIFLHKSSTCHCVPSLTKTPSAENSKQSRIPSAFSRRPRRQSPTPHEFYKNLPQSQNKVVNNEKSKSKPSLVNKCIKCNAPVNFTTLENAYLAKIQDLTLNNEMKERRSIQMENDLSYSLGLINKQLKINKVIEKEKREVQKRMDDIVDGLLNHGKTTFWARDQPFSIIRELSDKMKTPNLPDDDTTLPINKSMNSSKEVHMKAIIGQQELTIQNLLNNIKDFIDIPLKIDCQSAEKTNSLLTLFENNISNMGYMDSSGTTYFSPPPPYITDAYFSSIKPSRIENNKINENNSKLLKETISDSEFSHPLESFTKEDSYQILSNGNWKNDKNKCTQSIHQLSKNTVNCVDEKTNKLDTNELKGNNDIKGCDDSL